jgi:guanylate kinase
MIVINFYHRFTRRTTWHRLFLISGPSGCGKSTVAAELLARAENLKLSISATTRTPRKGEKDGTHYFFLEEDIFLRMIKENAFYEYAKVFDHYYGTPKEAVQKMRDEGCDVLLEIDVQGAMQVKAAEPDAVLIFIMPPSLEELENRLVSRHTDSAAQLALRIKKAKEEIDQSVHYDYIVINDDLGTCVARVFEIYAKYAQPCAR